MITCSRCGKENQDHYKFCLGCGNELPKAAPAPAPAGHGAGNAEMETARTVLPSAPVGNVGTMGLHAAMAMPVIQSPLRVNQR